MNLNPSNECGSRAASRVRIRTPQGSRWDGQTGVVTRIVGRTVFVRFGDTEVPFGLSNIDIVPTPTP